MLDQLEAIIFIEKLVEGVNVDVVGVITPSRVRGETGVVRNWCNLCILRGVKKDLFAKNICIIICTWWGHWEVLTQLVGIDIQDICPSVLGGAASFNGGITCSFKYGNFAQLLRMFIFALAWDCCRIFLILVLVRLEIGTKGDFLTNPCWQNWWCRSGEDFPEGFWFVLCP